MGTTTHPRGPYTGGDGPSARFAPLAPQGGVARLVIWQSAHIPSLTPGAQGRRWPRPSVIRRMSSTHRVAVVEEPLDQPLRILVMESEPVGHDHVLEKRAREHRGLQRALIRHQPVDCGDGARGARAGPVHELLQRGVRVEVACEQVRAHPLERVELVLECGGHAAKVARADARRPMRCPPTSRPRRGHGHVAFGRTGVKIFLADSVARASRGGRRTALREPIAPLLDGALDATRMRPRAQTEVQNLASGRHSIDHLPRLESACLQAISQARLISLSAPGRTRTCDPRLRRPPLYPAELPGRVVVKA